MGAASVGAGDGGDAGASGVTVYPDGVAVETGEGCEVGTGDITGRTIWQPGTVKTRNASMGTSQRNIERAFTYNRLRQGSRDYNTSVSAGIAQNCR